MFIRSKGYRAGYLRDGTQVAQGLFLVLLCSDTEKYANGRRKLRAFVRRAELRQSGHFMPGTIRATLNGQKIVIGIEGTYGNNGLPHDTGFRNHVDRTVEYDKRPFVDLWDVAHDLPEPLAETFWSGGGHNGAGSEEKNVWEWATENLKTLQRWRKVA